MNVLIIQASPNEGGLTASCAKAAAEGVQAAGGQATLASIARKDIARCKQCKDGWGGCRPYHECYGTEDDFQPLHQLVREADGYVLVTPVYWGDMSESLKAFTDRLRRCEAPRGDESALANKPIICVAAAGGSGGGMISCLEQMERWLGHVRARRFDLIPINRWNAAYKVDTVRAAAQAMVSMG
ncbi:MAG: flavodoxin family protein [Anaerolineales bacterium]